mmetsp:Transcript_881/g.2406  ORF Transcript_881/g.2406 Transcript_881/m.2406 type:complete len:202 (-) Transcript_881:18-623(-)
MSSRLFSRSRYPTTSLPNASAAGGSTRRVVAPTTSSSRARGHSQKVPRPLRRPCLTTKRVSRSCSVLMIPRRPSLNVSSHTMSRRCPFWITMPLLASFPRLMPIARPQRFGTRSQPFCPSEHLTIPTDYPAALPTLWQMPRMDSQDDACFSPRELRRTLSCRVEPQTHILKRHVVYSGKDTWVCGFYIILRDQLCMERTNN